MYPPLLEMYAAPSANPFTPGAVIDAAVPTSPSVTFCVWYDQTFRPVTASMA